ncbi:hypothetical protein B0H14DRAFT_3487051 [Mycena olivaceomarginata]|nr:hypothetical protein B0H14DRAFT_3487051 [Mycena olivaceomarginata]
MLSTITAACIISVASISSMASSPSQSSEFATVDYQALQNTREIFYSVEFHPKMFDNLDEAAETWERIS